MKLNEAEIGHSYKVLSLKGEGKVKRRLRDMGIIRGTIIKYHKVAPLGDPLQITLRGYELSLRKQDAEIVEVERVEE
ncbi:MAG: ferrous iron transport protein A [Gallicola sp.]|jgi:ferrous iron transport protein A|uniref:FeoA family protein n=1 Tax=Gallicola sp. Sow4_E12 TaxID=3438785 RepID=UPI0017A242AE|nr:ferrous iron transport protein A [Gallicola sp.]